MIFARISYLEWGSGFWPKARGATIRSCVWRIWSGQYGNCYLVSGRAVVNHWDCISGNHRYLGPVFYRFIPLHPHHQYNLVANSLLLYWNQIITMEWRTTTPVVVLCIAFTLGLNRRAERCISHGDGGCGWINIIAGGRGGRPLHTSGPLLLNQDLLLSRCVVKD